MGSGSLLAREGWDWNRKHSLVGWVGGRGRDSRIGERGCTETGNLGEIIQECHMEAWGGISSCRNTPAEAQDPGLVGRDLGVYPKGCTPEVQAQHSPAEVHNYCLYQHQSWS